MGRTAQEPITCWHCAKRGKLVAIRLRNRRSGEILRVSLCFTCLVGEHRSWRLAWEPAEEVTY